MSEQGDVEIIHKTAVAVDPYMSKADMLTQLQLSVDAMIAEGKCPPGTKVIDVRIRDVEFILQRPDGKSRRVGAMLIPHDEIEESGFGEAPQSFFAPGTGTKQ